MRMTDHTEVKDSSAITDVWFNNDKYCLAVRFTNGNYAAYSAVGPNAYRNLISANSVGGYYNARIKDYYSGLSVTSIEMDAPSGLMSKSEVEALVNKNTFVVKGKVTGTLTMTLDADDVEGAIVAFQKAVADVLGNDQTFTVSLESVNPA